MLKTIDLFAGAGGLSYGFESTGEFLIVAAAENNKNARKTYIENHKGRNDIRLIPDVFIVGVCNLLCLYRSEKQ